MHFVNFNPLFTIISMMPPGLLKLGIYSLKYSHLGIAGYPNFVGNKNTLTCAKQVY